VLRIFIYNFIIYLYLNCLCYPIGDKVWVVCMYLFRILNKLCIFFYLCVFWRNKHLSIHCLVRWTLTLLIFLSPNKPAPYNLVKCNDVKLEGNLIFSVCVTRIFFISGPRISTVLILSYYKYFLLRSTIYFHFQLGFWSIGDVQQLVTLYTCSLILALMPLQ
jgi:hypothetical protein